MRFCPAILGMLLVASVVRAEDITGFGRNVDDAKLDARQHVLERLNDMLVRQNLQAWRPGLVDIDAFITGPGWAGQSIYVEPLGRRDSWVLPVQFPAESEMIRRDRQARRRSLMATILVGISLGLAAFWLAGGQKLSMRPAS